MARHKKEECHCHTQQLMAMVLLWNEDEQL